MKHPISHLLLDIIHSEDPDKRNTPLDGLESGLTDEELSGACLHLDDARRKEPNLYLRVRTLFFLQYFFKYSFTHRLQGQEGPLVPAEAAQMILNRRYSEAIDILLKAWKEKSPSASLASALGEAYYQLGIQNLADQVKHSVRSTTGNRWMFRTRHPMEQPLRIDRRMYPEHPGELCPILKEATAVRMDLSHSSWSDIFFLGMDLPEAAKVINASVDLGVLGRDPRPVAPIECYFRLIPKPVIRLVSVDLNASTEIHKLEEIFNFGSDYLGLIKAAVIASGLVPPGLEGSNRPLSSLLERMIRPGWGFEVTSHVKDIPKGSRLAVSTNLLAGLISLMMRVSGQTASLEGPLNEEERRVAAARAILGEWLGGSGGGWQDSGGIWPGIKRIEGVQAREGDPEYGISRGRLMPSHTPVIEDEQQMEELAVKLEKSLVLVHGGMAQNVGPVLEMVTEKYLLRLEDAWEARQESLRITAGILEALRKADIRELARLTHEHFQGPIQTIIPWANNAYTQALIDNVSRDLGDDFWGFLMLGGMSGGGMGFFVNPASIESSRSRIHDILLSTKKEMERALPFAMDPLVYEFRVNFTGTRAQLLTGQNALPPPGYYRLRMGEDLSEIRQTRDPYLRREFETLRMACQKNPVFRAAAGDLFLSILPGSDQGNETREALEDLLESYGFDPIQHEGIREDLKAGIIGLNQNRLHAQTRIEDFPTQNFLCRKFGDKEAREAGEEALAKGEVGVVTLAAGLGTRWTKGAGVIKALNPFHSLESNFFSFLDIHLAKTRSIGRQYDQLPPHVLTTSYLTHEPIEQAVHRLRAPEQKDFVHCSQGQFIGLRMIPTTRDLLFAWTEQSSQKLDERAEKVRDDTRKALLEWARSNGEASDYTDNLPHQCLHPVGHWYEIPSLLLNGTLLRLLKQRPQLKTLLIHNIDTLGAYTDPVHLGRHLLSGNPANFEVIRRTFHDQGGGLATINGQPRLIEGMALPREELEYELSYYNTLTSWVDIDALLKLFGCDRNNLHDQNPIRSQIRNISSEIPTYVTLKEVKKRWGNGQEDIYPVCQFEKLWGDVTTLPQWQCGFMEVNRFRGQQLKDPAMLDPWLRDGSASQLNRLMFDHHGN